MTRIVYRPEGPSLQSTTKRARIIAASALVTLALSAALCSPGDAIAQPPLNPTAPNSDDARPSDRGSPPDTGPSVGRSPAGADVEAAQREMLYREIAADVAALERQGNLLKKVVRLVQPTVVHIEAEKPTNGNGKSPEEAGSGIVIEHKGRQFILTNRHVIRDSALEQIEIRTADGVRMHPTRVWASPETDVAVMGLAEPNLIAAKLGESSDLEIGDFVLAVGSPFGLAHSVTYGIVSAKQRWDLKLGNDVVRMQDFIQTDAAINPGNSGGPLLNLRGEVVGINTAIASASGGNEGIGFAIPIDLAIRTARELIDRGAVSQAFLGVLLDHKFDLEAAVRLGLPRAEGALVKGITPDSPADEAKFLVSDVILRFDGVRIEDDDHLINRVAITPVDKEVSVVILRDGKPQTIRVRVGDRSQFGGN